VLDPAPPTVKRSEAHWVEEKERFVGRGHKKKKREKVSPLWVKNGIPSALVDGHKKWKPPNMLRQ